MDRNLKAYNSKAVIAWYNNLHGLMPAEAVIFEKYKDLVAGAAVLDIGIGGGRTTAYLAGRCKAYTGIDYVPGFIQALQQKYPGAAILAMDARNLSAYRDNSFDMVNFSFNGIDYADADSRQKILSEIHRVLRPGGMFFFSTHNKSHSSFNEWPWRDKKISALIKVKTFIKLIPFLSRKIKNRPLELFNNEFAVINDPAHSYSLMTFYTTPQFQREQLQQAGFGNIAFYSRAGQAVPDAQLDEWIYITAVRS